MSSGAEGLGYDIGIDDAKIIPHPDQQPGQDAGGLQSADIGSCSPTASPTVRGRGELVDDVAGMAHHRVKVTAPDGGWAVCWKADVVLIAGAKARGAAQAVPTARGS